MKTRIASQIETPWSGRWGLTLIARFGRARLFGRADGRAELRDATPAEETEAKEWISLFEHDTVLHIARPA